MSSPRGRRRRPRCGLGGRRAGGDEDAGGHLLGLPAARIGQVQPRGLPGSLLARWSSWCRADTSRITGRGGRAGLIPRPPLRGRCVRRARWAGGSAARGTGTTYRQPPVDAVRRRRRWCREDGQDRRAEAASSQRRPPGGPGGARGRGDDLPRLPPAGGLARAGRRRAAGGLPRTRSTGAGRSPGSVTPMPGCASSAWRPPPTAPTAPGGCSPATAPATSSTPPCTAPASPTSRRRPAATTACALTGAWITAPVRCAPPANKPTPAERDTCRPWLERELALAARHRRVRAAARPVRATRCCAASSACAPARASATASRSPLPDGRAIAVGSYHVSQQNTFTGTLTPAMFDAVLLTGPRRWPDWPRRPEHVVSGADRGPARGGKAPMQHVLLPRHRPRYDLHRCRHRAQRHGRGVTLGNRTASVPSVVFLRDDGEFLIGEAATRRAATDPGRVAREFKRRVGDPTPIILGGTPVRRRDAHGPHAALGPRPGGRAGGRPARGHRPRPTPPTGAPTSSTCSSRRCARSTSTPT